MCRPSKVFNSFSVLHHLFPSNSCSCLPASYLTGKSKESWHFLSNCCVLGALLVAATVQTGSLETPLAWEAHSHYSMQDEKTKVLLGLWHCSTLAARAEYQASYSTVSLVFHTRSPGRLPRGPALHKEPWKRNLWMACSHIDVK